MLKDKYVFAQLVKYLDNDKFRHIVDKYDGDKYVKRGQAEIPVHLLNFGIRSVKNSGV